VSAFVITSESALPHNPLSSGMAFEVEVPASTPASPAVVAQLNSMAQSSPTRPDEVGPCRVRQLEASSAGSTLSSHREMGTERVAKKREQQQH
jgi:hypothetical protein